MSKYNIQNIKNNNKTTKFNWELHQKLQKKYNEYLTDNQVNIKLKGNSNFNNRPISYYLENNKEPITNENLTPIPIREKKYLKKKERIKEYSNMQRSVVQMRRIEYNNKLKKKNKKIENYEYYYKIPLIITIQRLWKKRYNKLSKKAEKIQSKFKQYIFRKYFLFSREVKNNIDKLVFIIQKVLFLNFAKIKILKLNKEHCFITKKRGRFDEVKLIQRYIRNHLITKKCKMIFNKQKCVFYRPIQDLNLNVIKKIQNATIKYLEIIKGRKKILNSFTAVKKIIPLSKIIKIQRFIKGIYRKQIKDNIPKEGFDRYFYFTKIIHIETEKHKNEIMMEKMKYNTNIIPFRTISLRFFVIPNQLFITKIHKKLEKIILLQKNIRIFLKNIAVEYDYIDIPKNHEYVTKYDLVMFEQWNLINLQRKIKYFLYRQKMKKYTFQKVKLEPKILTKSIRTSTEKIFERLSKLRIEYDKNLILMIVRLIENTRKACARLWFYKLKYSEVRKIKMIIKKVKNENDSIKIINPLSNIKRRDKFHPIIESIKLNKRAKKRTKNFYLPSSDIFHSVIFKKNNSNNSDDDDNQFEEKKKKEEKKEIKIEENEEDKIIEKEDQNIEEDDKSIEEEINNENKKEPILNKLREMNKEKTLKKKMTVINEESSENSSNSQIRNSEKKITPKNNKMISYKSLSRNSLIDTLFYTNSIINKRKNENNNIKKDRHKSNSLIILRDTDFTFNDF